LRAAVKDRDARIDLLTFQLGELDRAALQDPSEDVELAALRKVLASAERVERLCAESYGALYERDDAILGSLGGVWRRVGELASLEPKFQPFLDARDGIKSQLEDLAAFLRSYADGIEASPTRQQQIEERLALLERLKRKHGPTLEEAIARRDALRKELTDLEGGDDRLATLERAFAVSRDEYVRVARELSSARRRIAAVFAKGLIELLRDLAMEQTRFEVRFADGPASEDTWTARGLDRCEFFVSPNPGEDLRPLARIVSGGELSRVMLAVKTLTATSRHGFSAAADRPPSASAPGLIFDEVDAGIGGRVADVVGRKLRTLGSAFQVLCITHLPQIAAYADTHFQIEKHVGGGRTRTTVQRLSIDGRVDEVARMLGGEAITDGLRRTAREMLEAKAVRPVEGPGIASDPRPAKGESESPRRKRK
jgi:DNA repair protein RecN (Recombination protein N)